MNAQWLLVAVIGLMLLVDVEAALGIVAAVAVIMALSWAADALMHRNDARNKPTPEDPAKPRPASPSAPTSQS